MSKNTPDISRRSFLGASAVALASFGLAGCAPRGSGDEGQAQNAPAEQAAPDPLADYTTESLLGYEPQPAELIAPVEVPESWDQEADVVVVGAGGAGLMAALCCAEKGKSVIVLEKSGYTGGDTNVTNNVAVVGCKSQVEAGMVLPDGMVEAIVQSVWASKSYSFDTDSVTKLVHKATEAVDYLIDGGADLVPCPRGEGGVNWRGEMDDGCAQYVNKILMTHIRQKAEAAGAQIITSASAAALVMDGGAVVGVQTADGKHYKGGATILCTGGFGANREMLAKYIPSAIQLVSQCGNSPSSIGEGQLMAWGAGAGMSGYNSYFALDGGIDSPLLPWTNYFYTGYTQLIRQPWMRVDKTCKRVPYISTLDQIDAAIGIQGTIDASHMDHRTYVFFDSNYEQYAPAYKEEVCRWLFTSDMPSMQNEERIGSNVNDWREGAKQGIEQGIIVSADTIAELAEKLGLDGELMEQRVAEWNEICANGVDPVCGYKDIWLNPIDTPPYYGVKTSASIISTLCGPKVNDDCQVIDVNGAVIPGLYAAGICAGVGGINLQLSNTPLGGASLALTTAYVASQKICA